MSRAAFLASFFCAIASVFSPLGAQEKPNEPVVEPQPKASTPSEPKTTISYIHVDGREIAMTFDDGPSEKLTPKLLDLLASRHIKATFFVLGECVAKNSDILARAVREGHEIASHSWSHPQLNRMSDAAVRSELKRTDDIIKSATGKRPTLFRPPYGALTSRQKKWIHDEFGYAIILWDVDPFDWKEPGPTRVCERIVRNTRAGSIILSHDIHAGTVEAMPATFDQLEAKGFKFVTVSELMAMETPEPPKPKPTERAHTPATTSPAPQKSASPATPKAVPVRPGN